MRLRSGALPSAAQPPRFTTLAFSKRISSRAPFRKLQPCRAELASDMPRNVRGERDATQAENISGFAEKPLGFYDTAHIVRGPDGLLRLVGLSAREIQLDSPVLSETDVNKFRNQTPGWRLQSASEGAPFLRQEWKAKDAEAAKEMLERIKLVTDEAGRKIDTNITDGGTVAAEMHSNSQGGLTEAEFIIAARINAISFKDLLPQRKARFWA